MDILLKVLMGNDMEPSRKPAVRRLECDDPKIRNKYTLDYDTFIKVRDLRTKMRVLYQTAKSSGKMTKDTETEYESLDKLRRDGANC
jgi:hypothetical protein